MYFFFVKYNLYIFDFDRCVLLKFLFLVLIYV
jgi:hypothetical protein